MDETMYDRESVAARESVAIAMRELLGQDPSIESPDRIREWGRRVMTQMQAAAALETRADVRQHILRDVSNFELQLQAMSGPREPDRNAWSHIVGGMKDTMSEILHGPAVEEAA